ncbi:DNA-binding anti-repressor SinI [Gottfriedia luciferensis]|nr:DNA-binding anti-repressor SinI [Gottfriedia luciferensis]
MQADLEKDSTELNWIDLLLECIEVGISPEEVRSFLYNSVKDSCQN